MRLLQVTIGAGTNTQVTTQKIYASFLIIQNNAGAVCRFGDNTTSSTKGIQLASGSPGGSSTCQFYIPKGTDLSQYYLAGTQGNVIDILYESSM